MFENTKVIVSLYDNQIKGKLDKKVVDKLKFDEIQDKNLSILDDPTYENLYKISLHSLMALFLLLISRINTKIC